MGILTNLILMQWTLEKYSKYADGVAERSTKMKEGFSKIKEELPTEPAETTFIDAKQNSESDMARQDVDLEAQEEVEDEAEIEGSVEAEAEIEIAIDVAAKAVCVEVGTMEGHKSHANTINTNAEDDCIMTKEYAPAAEYAATTMLRDQPKDPMKCVSIHGPTEAEITVEYTWKHFFQEGFATEASHWSRPLFFTLSKTQAVAESSQGNWILVRVSKAHWGRSPKFIWKYNSCGPGCDETMAHLITNSAASSTQRTETWCDAETKTISLDPLFAMSAVSVGQLVQVEDEEATADCSSVSEPYGVLYLALGANMFEFSAVKWFQVFNVLLGRDDYKEEITMSMVIVPAISKHSLVWTVHDFQGAIYAATETMNLSGILELLEKVSINKKVLGMSNLHVDIMGRPNKDEMPRASSIPSSDSIMLPPSLIEWVGQVGMCKKGIMLPDFLGTESMNGKGLVLFLLVTLSKPDNSFLWIGHGAQDFASVAMAIKKGGFTATEFCDVECFQIGIIHFGRKTWYYCFINDVLAPFKQFQNRFAPPRHFLAGLIILLYSLRVPGTTVAGTPFIVTCSQYCWLGFCPFFVIIIEEMLISVKSANFVITTIPDLAQTWIKSFDIKKQKLTSNFTYHLEDKVALHGGGIDGIGLRPSDKG